MRFKNLSAAIVASLLVALVWLSWPGRDAALPAPVVATSGLAHAREPLLPLPEPPKFVAEKVELGQALFFEPRLSHDDSISCASCHDLNRGGSDRLRFSPGVGNALGNINTPTVFNAGLNFVQFWDGRAASLEAQAAGPVHNPAEMASSWPEVLAKLTADEKYRRAFSDLYPDGMTAANLVDAIATFERTLLTTNARFDRYLKGDDRAIGELERSGYLRFKDYGCASCHQGANVGGNMYQRFGVMADYFADRPLTKADLGRFNVTGLEDDRHVFKVPSLRNVAVTPPYFHDASAATLADAVTIMGRYQLGRELTPEDVRAITAFLHSLTGEWQGRVLQ